MAPLVHTSTAPTNIALIKYWGKRDVKLNLPINGSLSITISQDELQTKTTVRASKDFDKDRLWLNGKEEDISGNSRMLAVLELLRQLARDKMDESTGAVIVAAKDWGLYKLHIVSENSFPTAAGLASSASGYACLVHSVASLFNVDMNETEKLTEIARRGSGSASRSLHGGYVKWDKGVLDDGSDSVATQVVPESHWPEIEVLICVANMSKKEVSSTSGMVDSVNTSPLLKFRADTIVAGRLKQMEEAIKAKDFKAVAELTMKDSNQFHATCLDTFPPIVYMEPVSHGVAALVHKLNNEGIMCAYTYDAGPNAVLLMPKENVPRVLSRLVEMFGPAKDSTEEMFVRGRTQLSKEDALSKITATHDLHLKYIIHSGVGKGATSSSAHLAEP